MAEQDSSIGPVNSIEEKGDVTPPDSLNGDVNETSAELPAQDVAKTVAEQSPTVDTVVLEKTTEETSANAPEKPTLPESEVPVVIETPVDASPKTMEGETQEVDHKAPETPVQKEEPVQKAPEPIVASEPAPVPVPAAEPHAEVVANGEASVVAAKEETTIVESTESTPVVDDTVDIILVEKPKEVEIQPPVQPASPPPSQEQPQQPTETNLEKISEQQPVPDEGVAIKPQIIGETYHHVTKAQPSSPKVPAVVLKNTFPSPTERTFRAESKIALEIQEMQKREEELKKMRERTVAENTSVKAPSESNQSEGSVHSDDSLCQSPLQSLSSVVAQNISRSISLDTVPNGQAYNIGYAFGRKDNVKVKPLVEPQETEEEKLKAMPLKETPIEKEIRIAREREEELRKEKGLQIENGHEESLVRPTSLTKSRVAATKPVGDTQRILATSRIQQEIEEQTEREKSLRASGVIKTISQERTDSRVAGRLGELTNGDSGSYEKTPLSPVSSNGDKSASPTFNGNGTNGTSSPVNGKVTNGSVKTPSPSNSTVSSSPLKANPAGRRFSNPPPGRGVNMQRFISSKGKDVAFKTFNGNGLEKSTSLVALDNELYELKPPQVPVQNKLNQRRSVTLAGPRIQEELKEMQEREDELKKQRSRMLGLSQPNLSVLGTEDDIVTNGHDEKPSLDRSSSIPNLLENGENEQNGHDKKDSPDGPVGTGPRRRSTLIDQWEQRIQKLDIKS